MRLRQFFLVSTLLVHSTVQAWNAAGHMLVAEVASRYLSPSVADEVQSLTAEFAKEYNSVKSFHDMAVWSDDIKGHDVRLYDSWHYVDYPFRADAGPMEKAVDAINVEWAIAQNRNILKSTRSNTYERAQALAMLVHFIGDIHQPMHSATRISDEFPEGDRGGNDFKLTGKYYNLHALWDAGMGWLKSIHSPVSSSNQKWLQQQADYLIESYPPNRLEATIQMDEKAWAQESFELAQTKAYNNIAEKLAPTTIYLSENTLISQQQVALAGYRLANALNCIYQVETCDTMQDEKSNKIERS